MRDVEGRRATGHGLRTDRLGIEAGAARAPPPVLRLASGTRARWAIVLAGLLSLCLQHHGVVRAQERAEPAFSLSSGEVVAPGSDISISVGFERLDHLDFRIYRIADPVAFFAGLRICTSWAAPSPSWNRSARSSSASRRGRRDGARRCASSSAPRSRGIPPGAEPSRERGDVHRHASACRLDQLRPDRPAQPGAGRRVVPRDSAPPRETQSREAFRSSS